MPFVLFFIKIHSYYQSSPLLAIYPCRPESASNHIHQKPQCFTSASCSSPSKPPSRRLSVSSNIAPGLSFLLPKDQVWADCTSLTLSLVSKRLYFFSPKRKGTGKLECTDLDDFADTSSVSCGDVCRHAWEGQSKIDDGWGTLAEGEVFMTLAALIRNACQVR